MHYPLLEYFVIHNHVLKFNIILATTVSYIWYIKYVKKKYISRPDAMDKPFIQDIQNLIKKHIKMIIPGAEEGFTYQT